MVDVNTKVYKCSLCQKLFLSRDKLEQHVCKVSHYRHYRCRTCRQRFFRIGQLQEHERIHNYGEAHKCHLCSKRFIMASKLHFHIQNHHVISSTDTQNADIIKNKAFKSVRHKKKKAPKKSKSKSRTEHENGKFACFTVDNQIDGMPGIKLKIRFKRESESETKFRDNSGEAFSQNQCETNTDEKTVEKMQNLVKDSITTESTQLKSPDSPRIMMRIRKVADTGKGVIVASTTCVIQKDLRKELLKTPPYSKSDITRRSSPRLRSEKTEKSDLMQVDSPPKADGSDNGYQTMDSEEAFTGASKSVTPSSTPELDNNMKIMDECQISKFAESNARSQKVVPEDPKQSAPKMDIYDFVDDDDEAPPPIKPSVITDRFKNRSPRTPKSQRLLSSTILDSLPEVPYTDTGQKTKTTEVSKKKSPRSLSPRGGKAFEPGLQPEVSLSEIGLKLKIAKKSPRAVSPRIADLASLNENKESINNSVTKTPKEKSGRKSQLGSPPKTPVVPQIHPVALLSEEGIKLKIQKKQIDPHYKPENNTVRNGQNTAHVSGLSKGKLNTEPYLPVIQKTPGSEAVVHSIETGKKSPRLSRSTKSSTSDESQPQDSDRKPLRTSSRARKVVNYNEAQLFASLEEGNGGDAAQQNTEKTVAKSLPVETEKSVVESVSVKTGNIVSKSPLIETEKTVVKSASIETEKTVVKAASIETKETVANLLPVAERTAVKSVPIETEKNVANLSPIAEKTEVKSVSVEMEKSVPMSIETEKHVTNTAKTMTKSLPIVTGKTVAKSLPVATVDSKITSVSNTQENDSPFLVDTQVNNSQDNTKIVKTDAYEKTEESVSITPNEKNISDKRVKSPLPKPKAKTLPKKKKAQIVPRENPPSTKDKCDRAKVAAVRADKTDDKCMNHEESLEKLNKLMPGRLSSTKMSQLPNNQNIDTILGLSVESLECQQSLKNETSVLASTRAETASIGTPKSDIIPSPQTSEKSSVQSPSQSPCQAIPPPIVKPVVDQNQNSTQKSPPPSTKRQSATFFGAFADFVKKRDSTDEIKIDSPVQIIESKPSGSSKGTIDKILSAKSETNSIPKAILDLSLSESSGDEDLGLDSNIFNGGIDSVKSRKLSSIYRRKSKTEGPKTSRTNSYDFTKFHIASTIAEPAKVEEPKLPPKAIINLDDLAPLANPDALLRTNERKFSFSMDEDEDDVFEKTTSIPDVLSKLDEIGDKADVHMNPLWSVPSASYNSLSSARSKFPGRSRKRKRQLVSSMEPVSLGPSSKLTKDDMEIDNKLDIMGSFPHQESKRKTSQHCDSSKATNKRRHTMSDAKRYKSTKVKDFYRSQSESVTVKEENTFMDGKYGSIEIKRDLDSCDVKDDDGKYKLRPKRRNSFQRMCECCFHEGEYASLRKPFNAKMFASQQKRLVQFRHKVCNLLNVLFPNVQYPARFNSDTPHVEALIDEVIKIVCEEEDLKDEKGEKSNSDAIQLKSEVKVLLCKMPRRCMKRLRQKTCKLLSVLLPDCSFTKELELNTGNVEKVLDLVIENNKKPSEDVVMETVPCNKEILNDNATCSASPTENAGLSLQSEKDTQSGYPKAEKVNSVEIQKHEIHLPIEKNHVFQQLDSKALLPNDLLGGKEIKDPLGGAPELNQPSHNSQNVNGRTSPIENEACIKDSTDSIIPSVLENKNECTKPMEGGGTDSKTEINEERCLMKKAIESSNTLQEDEKG